MYLSTCFESYAYGTAYVVEATMPFKNDWNSGIWNSLKMQIFQRV